MTTAVEPKSSSHRLRGRLTLAAKAAVSIGLLGYLFSRIDLSVVGVRLSSAPAGDLWVLAAAAILQVGLLFLRWRLVVAGSGVDLPTRVVAGNICMGLLFNQVLLSAIGGDAVRIVDLIRRKIGVERAVTLVFVDRLSALLGMTLLIAATLPGFFRDDGPAGGLAAAGTALAPVAAAGAVGLIALLLWDRPPAVFVFGPVGRAAARFWVALRMVLACRRTGIAVLGLAMLIHVLTAVNVHLFAVSFGVAATLLDCLMLVPPVFLLATLPLSVGGWGVREGGFVVAFALVGVGGADALALSVAVGLLGVAQGILGGAVWLGLEAACSRRPPTVSA